MSRNDDTRIESGDRAYEMIGVGVEWSPRRAVHLAGCRVCAAQNANAGERRESRFSAWGSSAGCEGGRGGGLGGVEAGQGPAERAAAGRERG